MTQAPAGKTTPVVAAAPRSLWEAGFSGFTPA